MTSRTCPNVLSHGELSDSFQQGPNMRLCSVRNIKYDEIQYRFTSGECVVEELGVYIVAIDRPGYGESDPDPNRTIKSMAFDIEELADELNLGLKFYVVGHSMGGMIVWSCLKYIPHRFVVNKYVGKMKIKLTVYTCSLY
ncbi:alpha/beta hydrolase fold protein [Tanacetum coccineum]